MVDSLTPEQRSAQMSRIRGSNTRLELLVRKGLHARGLRYRLGGGGLPGRPDIVLAKHNIVVLVHGCFWHGHSCPLYRLPKTRPEFWAAKIGKNRERDQRDRVRLQELGWRVLEVWECALRGQSKDTQEAYLDQLAAKIRASD
ncbi:very short patch repair endonuclease [Stenotrophomonas maltophilia]|uniref:very short patch repair endonuclease n=1 Tax=Stenotrophomonas maltophilia TaxID=40324 RepID=UPI0016612E4B|nr:very short patch repair endonuclease [Stenotrophomonas maltophilia]